MELKDRDGLARICKFRGVETPALMPVINPNLIVLSPREMREKFGVAAIITNSYIIWKNKELREKALKEGLHKMLDFDGLIMTDSGTFQSYVYGDVEVRNREIVKFQREIGSDIGTILDVFTEPDFSEEEVKNAIEETARRGEEAKKYCGNMLLAGPVQGSIYPHLREYAAKKMSGIGFDYYPIGGVVPLLENYRYAEVVEAIIHAKMHLNPSKPVHLFGGGHPMFFPFAVILGVDFFDSAAYVKYARDERLLFPYGTRRLEELKYPPYYSPILERYSIEEIKEMSKEEKIRVLAEHNLYISLEEIIRIKQAIYEESLWEYVETRAREHPQLLKAYYKILEYGKWLEKFESISKKSGFFYTGKESLRRPIVLRLKKRLRRFQRGGIIISVPRPWSNYLERIPRNARVRTPFGLIPLELEDIYPVQQSEFPWEERMDIPENFEEISQKEFDLRKIRAIADYQFGKGAGHALFSGNLRLIKSKNTGKIRNVVVDGEHVASLRAEDGFFTLRIHGAVRLHRYFKFPKFRVVVNEDSAEFNRQGRNVFAKFIIDMDENLRPGDEAIIVDSRDNILAVGRTLMNRVEALSFEKGMCVKVREGIDKPKSGLLKD
ncbi:MAG: tRNA guanosine(15) transglycosylase TgtA [Thermoplasmata archaeon]|nr:tRNA guanosine(15) transglycosylase TgtA [Thermoplasmata archaeon]